MFSYFFIGTKKKTDEFLIDIQGLLIQKLTPHGWIIICMPTLKKLWISFIAYFNCTTH